MKIPLCKPMIGKEELQEVASVLESGWLAHGPKTKAFEENFAKYIGTSYATALNSCASALQLAVQGLGLKGEIICPSFTMSATANSILAAGCSPVFVDVEWESCNISPEKISEKISEKTAAIMPVHFAGQSCKMDEIIEIAKEKDLAIIEDSAEAIGAEFNRKKTGSFGTGCFSFYPTKNMTTGEGGMITTDNEELFKKCKALKAHGIESTASEREKKERPWIRNTTMAGYNFRMCDVLAAIGLKQLEKIDKMNDLRRKNSEFLNKELSDLEGIEVPIEQPKCKHVYQMYTIKLGEEINRPKFIAFLREKGIGASVHFDPTTHQQTLYKKLKCKQGDLSTTDKIAKRIATLPMYPHLAKQELEYIAENVKQALKECKKCRHELARQRMKEVKRNDG